MTVEPATITLPDHLRPSDGRFGSGPSKVRTTAVAALQAAAPTYLGTSHRKARVKDVVGRVREGLHNLFALPDGYEILLGNGGATAFWDAAAFGLIERRSQHVVIGEFSSKFAAVAEAAPFLDAPERREAAPGTRIGPMASPDVDCYAFPHNETSTGVAMEIARPPGATGLVCVDATSAAGGMLVDPTAFDVYYFAPQKCFAADGGLWLAACSPAAIERIAQVGTSDRWVPPTLDLTIALENSRANQTYNTPALATLFLLAEQVDWLLDHGGLAWAASRCATSSQTLYSWAETHTLASPYVADPDARSSVTATIDFDPTIDAQAIAQVLRANGIVDTEPYRKLGRNQLRIACFPAIEPDDIATLTQAIDYIIDGLGASAGSSAR